MSGLFCLSFPRCPVASTFVLMQSTPAYITLKEALRIYESGDLFSIAFITANKRTRQGGQWRRYENCTRSKTVRAKESPVPAGASRAEVAYMVKNPNCFQNSTRNIKLPGGEIKQAHIRLIRQFNGRTVL